MATTGSPTRTLSELPSGSGLSPATPVDLDDGEVVAAVRADELSPWRCSPPLNVTGYLAGGRRRAATTWLLVRMWPARSRTKPVPVPCLAAAADMQGDDAGQGAGGDAGDAVGGPATAPLPACGRSTPGEAAVALDVRADARRRRHRRRAAQNGALPPAPARRRRSGAGSPYGSSGRCPGTAGGVLHGSYWSHCEAGAAGRPAGGAVRRAWGCVRGGLSGPGGRAARAHGGRCGAGVRRWEGRAVECRAAGVGRCTGGARRPGPRTAVGRGAVWVGLVQRPRARLPRYGCACADAGSAEPSPAWTSCAVGRVAASSPSVVTDGRHLGLLRVRRASRRGTAPPLRLRVRLGFPSSMLLPATAVSAPGRGRPCRGFNQVSECPRSGPVRATRGHTGQRRVEDRQRKAVSGRRGWWGGAVAVGPAPDAGVERRTGPGRLDQPAPRRRAGQAAAPERGARRASAPSTCPGERRRPGGRRTAAVCRCRLGRRPDGGWMSLPPDDRDRGARGPHGGHVVARHRAAGCRRPCRAAASPPRAIAASDTALAAAKAKRRASHGDRSASGRPTSWIRKTGHRCERGRRAAPAGT